MDRNLVSIIMLSHNRGQFVEESVRSILAQTYTNWELLFFDVNSKDDTASKEAEKFAELSIQEIFEPIIVAAVDAAVSEAADQFAVPVYYTVNVIIK